MSGSVLLCPYCREEIDWRELDVVAEELRALVATYPGPLEDAVRAASEDLFRRDAAEIEVRVRDHLRERHPFRLWIYRASRGLFGLRGNLGEAL